MSDDIFHEIHEDLRQQKLRAFWAENGAWIIGGAIAAIVLSGGISWWRSHALSRDMAGTAALLSAQNAGDAPALAALADAAKGDRALLARFAEARLHASRAERDQAAAAFTAAANTKGASALWRDLARLYAVAQKLDTGTPAELHAALAPLAADGNVWRWSAREMTATLLAREARAAEARKMLDQLLADPDTPSGIRARAAALRDTMGPAHDLGVSP